MRKQSVFIALALGCVLASYQNCSGGMQAANQDFQNTIEHDKRSQPEPDIDDLVAVKSAAFAKPSGAYSCVATDVPFSWPMGGKAYRDSIVVNYIDHDPTSGVADYKGFTGVNALTYDGHKGIDMSLASFRGMDDLMPVRAAAAGTVIFVDDTHEDRHTACENNNWNLVIIRHDNGFKTSYGHLKKSSVPVLVGQRVGRGDRIGFVGSSGCSTHPHLHFQAHNCAGKNIEPMKNHAFLDAPVYSRGAPTTIMELVAKQPELKNISEMKDPGNNTREFKADVTFSLGYAIAAAKVGDLIHVDFYDPSGAKSGLYIDHKLGVRFPLTHWWWNIYLHQTGVWKAVFKVNGVVQYEQLLKIVP